MLAPLTSADELDDALSLPMAVLFKHSSVCAVSSMALREMYRLAEGRPDLAIHLVDVRADRLLSAQIADRLGVRHESPQVLLIRHGELVWHGSHFQVTSERIWRAVQEVELEVAEG